MSVHRFAALLVNIQGNLHGVLVCVRLQKGVTLSTAKSKVQCTLVQEVRLSTGRTARRGLQV